MARYKDYDYSQASEYSLHYTIDNDIGLSIFDTRHRNDETGAPAYDPSILLKIFKIRNCVTNRGSLDKRK